MCVLGAANHVSEILQRGGGGKIHKFVSRMCVEGSAVKSTIRVYTKPVLIRERKRSLDLAVYIIIYF